jgi:hypothetical protein
VLPTISLRCCETSLEKEGEECADWNSEQSSQSENRCLQYTAGATHHIKMNSLLEEEPWDTLALSTGEDRGEGEENWTKGMAGYGGGAYLWFQQRQEGGKFEASLGYIESSRPA